MYEPYGENKGFKFDFGGLKEKLKERIKNLRSSKWLFVIIAIAAIAIAAGYTGFASYTAKITEYDARILILTKQLKAYEDNVSSCLSDLGNTKTDLDSFKTNYQTCLDEKQTVEGNLQSCNDDKKKLQSSITESESKISDWESKYQTIQNDYNNLQSEYGSMEQNYAKVCCFVGNSYYFLKDEIKVVCCSSKDVNSCQPEKPDNVDLIKSISC
jgi:chromosome segregation ATPase